MARSLTTALMPSATSAWENAGPQNVTASTGMKRKIFIELFRMVTTPPARSSAAHGFGPASHHITAATTSPQTTAAAIVHRMINCCLR